MSGRTGLMKLGTTFFGGSPTNATDGAWVLGREIEVKDAIRGWERVRVLRALRNSAGFALLPKRAIVIDGTGRLANGYAVAGQTYKLVDEQLPAAGVATNDIFWAVIQGPGLGLTDLANASADMAINDFVGPISAATSGATTAGRLRTRAVVAATADATAGQRNVTENDAAIGKCITGALTNSTNANVLIDMNPF